MFEGSKISSRQAVFLITTVIVPTSILFLPHMIYVAAKRDAWLSVLAITLFGLGVGDIIGRLGRRFPGQTVVQYSRRLLGPVLGGAVGLVYAGFFIYINAFVVREFSEMLVTNYYKETPQVVFVLGIVFVAVYIVWYGLEVLTRVNDMVLPLVLIMLGVLLITSVPIAEPENLLPVLDNGVGPVLQGAVPAAVFFDETVIMLVLISNLTRPAEARVAIAKAVLLVGLIQLLVVVTVVTVLGTLTENQLYPTLHLARHLRVGPYLANVDPLILLIWILGGFLKVTIFHYCATICAAQLLGLSGYGLVSVVNGAILSILAVVLWEDAIELSYQISRIIPPFFLAVQAGIPVLLLAVAFFKRQGVTAGDRN